MLWIFFLSKAYEKIDFGKKQKNYSIFLFLKEKVFDQILSLS